MIYFSLTLPYIMGTIIGIYLIGAALFLITDNRSPSSTFAWLLLFITLPIIGVIVYIFFGSNWHVFAQQNKLTQQHIEGDILHDLAPLLAQEKEVIEKIATQNPTCFKRKLLHLVSKNSSSLLTGYNNVEILQNASCKYPRLLADIKQAQHHIHLNYYIWTDDDFTQHLKTALIERVQAGVKIRCLYDASGGYMSKSYIQDLTDKGVEICPYLEYRSLTKIHNANYRSHRKIAVIDGHIGYIGGLNLDQDQLDGGKYFDSWRDTHLRITGETALVLQASFTVSWFNTTAKKVIGLTYFPPVDQEQYDFMPIQITLSGPDSQWQAIRQLYFFMIMAAETKVYLQSPFFIPDESIMEALKAAALSGVEVKMMFAPRGTTYSIPYWAANTYFKEVAEAGVQIFLYQKGYFHPKTLNIDGAICTIGTANMDIRSFSLNYEANAVIYDQKKAAQLERDFLEDLKHCEEWTVADYKSRNSLSRLRDSLARLLSPVL